MGLGDWGSESGNVPWGLGRKNKSGSEEFGTLSSRLLEESEVVMFQYDSNKFLSLSVRKLCVIV